MATLTVGLQLPVIAFIGSLLLTCCISVCTGDVPDNVVYTDLHKTIQKGSQVVLKCHFYGEPNAVYWKKGNDPSTSPNLAVWVDGGLHSGLCLLDKMCAMEDDYSLVIKNVSIADQGRYICKVSNYKGILVHNFTEVNVFALPEEPYPIIDECKGNLEENCTLLVTRATNITCTVLKYFPNVDLFFLHGVQKYTTSETLVWTNSDGTKSKSISINALPSEIPYVCVAFNIPGSPDQRTSTVTVTKLLSPSQSTEPLPVNESPVVKIAVTTVVCVVAVAGAGMVIFIIIYRRKHSVREKHTDEETDLMLKPLDIKGKISFYELWLLVSELTKDGMDQLQQTFREPGITYIAENLTKQQAYEILCTWKEGNQGNEATTLDAFIKAQYNSRGNQETTVPRETFELILWHINNTDKIYHFLQELMPDFAVVNCTTSERKKAVEVALDELVKWNNRPFEVNPLVSLSLALERARCSPVDRTFFQVPNHLQVSILPKEVEGFTDKLAGRHCKRLAMTLKISTKEVDAIIEGNNLRLFNTNLMIKEWLSEVECSNYEKRCKLDDAVIKIGRYDLQDYFGTFGHRFYTGDVRQLEKPHPKFRQFDPGSLFDDDISQLQKCVQSLSSDDTFELYKSIGYNVDYREAEKGKLEEKLKTWRNDIIEKNSRDVSSEEFRVLRQRLTKGSISIENTLTDQEIDSIASHVIAVDKQKELLTTLGFDNSVQEQHSVKKQLKAWRNAHGHDGKADWRVFFQKTLKHIGFAKCLASPIATKYIYQAELMRIASNLLMEDVLPLTKALGINQSTMKKYIRPMASQGDPDKCTRDLLVKLIEGSIHPIAMDRDDFSKTLRNRGFVNAALTVYFDYEMSLNELMNIIACVGEDDMERFLKNLDLCEDDMAECRDRGKIDKMKLLIIRWKHQIRPVPYQYRVEIATALRAAGLDELANDVLAGKHQKKRPNPDVLQDICSRLSFTTLREVCNLLGLGFTMNREGSTALLTKWVDEWMTKFDPNDTSFLSDPKKERKRVNDLLFRNGLHELAEEISALENCRP